MKAPDMQVKCKVSDCQHNRYGMCHANDLEVGVMGDNKVDTNAGTQCNSFKKRSNDL